MNYTTGDFLIRVKNAYMAGQKEINLPYSKVSYCIGKIFEKEGFIKKIEEKIQDNRKTLKIDLLYKNRKPALKNVKLVSKPSVHVYVGKGETIKTRGGFTTTIVSTSKGIMTGRQAQKEGVGGEVICQIA